MAVSPSVPALEPPETANASAEAADRGGEFTPRQLLRRGLPAIGAIAVLGLIVLFAPGLGEVRDLLAGASPGWIALAIALEALSFGSYIVMFSPIFCRGLSWNRSWQIGGSELAMGSLVPASGAAGVALGAWILHEGGMDSDRIARRSVAFLLIKSSVNFIAVALLGLLMFAGLFGTELPWTLTLLPALLSIALIAFVLAIPRFGPGTAPAECDSRPRRWWAVIRRTVITGTAESIDIARARNPRVIVGAIGYWAFDNAVLWATFHAFGFQPEIAIVLMGYLIGQLGGLLPIPGGIGGIDGGLIGTLIVYGLPAAVTAAAVLAYRIILFWMPLIVGGIAFVLLRRDMPANGELAACEAASRFKAANLPRVTIPPP